MNSEASLHALDDKSKAWRRNHHKTARTIPRIAMWSGPLTATPLT